LSRRIFVTGGTGYVGSRLIPLLAGRGHEVVALVRPGSEHKLPAASMPMLGDALDGASYEQNLEGCDTFVQLVGVAHPAPAMHAYIAARSACEAELQASMLNATILRPWYVLGPGHRWPYALIPFYWLAKRIPSTREGARRLGLVTVGTDAGRWRGR
jgi:uncharacterized protein YbjT (DUF2867 family)